jgi:outer membrane protein OmpA-like peptidoglycan-associated protein
MSSQLTNNLKALLRGLVLVLLLGTGLWLMDRVAQTTMAGKSPGSPHRINAGLPAPSVPVQTAPAAATDTPRTTSEESKPGEQVATQAALPPTTKTPDGKVGEPSRIEPAAQAPKTPAKETAKEVPAVKPDAQAPHGSKESPERGSTPRIVTRADGRYITTEPILFNSAQAAIRQGSLPTLGKLAALLKAQPEIKLMIIGYTDNLGLDENNARVSRERAAAVKDFLVSQGVEGSRLDYKGMGSQNPIASNDTQLGRQANRRIEFLITSPK